MTFVLSKLKGKNLVVKLNSLIKFVFKNNDSEYEIINSSNLQSIRFLFELLHPVENGHELIRIGSANDGGYLLPNDLRGVKNCYSAGVGGSTAFEDQLTTYDIKCFLADPTIADSEASHQKYNIEKFPISAATGDVLRLKMFGDVAGQNLPFQGVSLVDWVSSKSVSEHNESILKLDIEGGEYQVLLSTPANFLNKFRIICLELHSFPNIRNPLFLNNLMIPMLEKLKSNFDVIHVHPNNVAPSIKFLKLSLPHAIELTLHRKDRQKYSPIRLVNLRHPLDTETFPDRPIVKFSLS